MKSVNMPLSGTSQKRGILHEFAENKPLQLPSHQGLKPASLIDIWLHADCQCFHSLHLKHLEY